MPGVVYRSRPTAQKALLRSPGMPVYQHMQRISASGTREAKKVARDRLRIGSGEYLAGFSSRTYQGPAGPRCRITNSAPHALFIERGTRPHVIVPVRATRLVFRLGPARASSGRQRRFRTEGPFGGLVFAKRVMHPGTRPYRVLDTALRRTIVRWGI